MRRAGLSYRGKLRLRPTSQSASQTRPGCGSQRLLRCRLHPAGRGPNSSSLFPPLAAVVAVAPKGRAIGKPGHFRLTAEGPTGRKRAGAATEGRRFWISAPCHAAAGLDSGALLFPRHRALLVQWKSDRHASGSPFGGAGERSETERVYQSIVVFVRPTPMTAVLIFFQLLQPHTPSTRRLVRRWKPFSASSVRAPKMPSMRFPVW